MQIVPYREYNVLLLIFELAQLQVADELGKSEDIKNKISSILLISHYHYLRSSFDIQCLRRYAVK